MNTKRDCIPSAMLQAWFERIDALEQTTVTQTADINELQSIVATLEAAVVGNVNLSLLLINTDKDWLGYDITNVGLMDCASFHADGNVDVDGNITVGGTVDGVDVAGLKSAYDSHVHNGTNKISLSNLIIDASKNWNAKDISNVGNFGAKYFDSISGKLRLLTPGSSIDNIIEIARWSQTPGAYINILPGVTPSSSAPYWRFGIPYKSGYTPAYFNIWTNDGSSNTERFKVDTNGDVSIQTGKLIMGTTEIISSARALSNIVSADIGSTETDTLNVVTSPMRHVGTIASTNAKFSNSLYRELSGSTYQVIKSIKAFTFIGEYKLRVMCHVSGGGTAYVKVQKNGVDLAGSEVSGSTIDQYIGPYYDLQPGDKLTMLVRNSSGLWVICSAGSELFSICYDVLTTSADFVGGTS